MFQFPKKSISEISLKIKNTEVKVQIIGNETIKILNNTNLNTEAVYIDDPYAIDNPALRRPFYRQDINSVSHRDHLRIRLFNKKSTSPVTEALGEIMASKTFDKVFEKINSVCPGNIFVRPNTVAYHDRELNVAIDMLNVSTGMKTFVIIKTLMENGWLEHNGTIILDEPEIHLHPDWQLVLAELIVLLQIELNMHILINTHSPFFLNAVEVYSTKHGISNRCRYYLTEDSPKSSVIVDVSDNIDKINQKLGRSLQVLENARYSYD